MTGTTDLSNKSPLLRPKHSSRLLQWSSIISMMLILALDMRTPLGFANGDLYLASLLLAILSGNRRFVIAVTALSVLLIGVGAALSPPGLGIEYWLSNRLLSATELCVISALSLSVMRHLEQEREKQQALAEDNSQLRKLTPSPDNPLAPFQHSPQFQLFADAIPQIVWTATPDGSVDYVNLAFARYTGRKRETFVNRDGWLESVHPDDVDFLQQHWRTVIMNAETYDIEFRLRRYDGEWRWHLLQGAPVSDQTGTIIKWCGSAIDIHDLHTYAERFETVANATIDAIWDWDIKNNTIWWNHGISTLFGYDRDKVMSTPRAWFQYVHPDDSERVLTTIQETVKSDRNRMSLSYRFIRSDGRIAEIEENSFVVRDKNGRAVRMIGGMTDVTERNQLNEQLSHSQRLQTVGELTGGVAHDFNNLLTVIQGNNELLTEAVAGNKTLLPLTQMISQASERAAALVQRLLAFARRQPLDPHPVDIAALMANMFPLIRRVVPERIDMQLKTGADLPAVIIDPAQLENALLNLGLNARDAIDGKGSLTLEARCIELDQDYCAANPGVTPGDYVLVSVTDTGCGMDTETRKRAVDPFFTTKKVGEGSGLGLSMVYGFIKQSGGHMGVYSELGTGTEIRMYLPVYTRDEVSIPAAEPAATSGKFINGLAQQHATVLVVEDEELVRQYAEKQFRELGFEVVSASNGNEALARLDECLAANKRVGLLFSDVMMSGGINGPELAKLAQEKQADLPVLFTSGYSENAISHQGRLQSGAILLSKPWRRDDLAQKLEKMDLFKSTR